MDESFVLHDEGEGVLIGRELLCIDLQALTWMSHLYSMMKVRGF